MNRILYCLFVFSLLLGAGTVFAQEGKQLPPKTAKVRPDKPAFRIKTKWGIMGHFHMGVSWGFFNNLQKDLEKPEFFSENWTLNNLGTNYGGNVMFQIGNYLMVGGGGNGFTYDASLASFARESKPLGNEQGEARQSGYYFTPMIGLCLINRAFYEYDYASNQYNFRYRWMLYPYLGLGIGGENTLRLNNYSQDRKFFGTPPVNPGAPIPPNTVVIPRSESREFTTSLTMLELGVGTKFMKNEKGGITLGGEIGGYFSLGEGTWKAKEGGTEIKGVNGSSMAGIYLRATVGGSFFNNKEILPGKARSTSASDDGYTKPEEVEKPKKEKKKKKEEEAPSGPAPETPKEGGGN